MKKSIVIKQDGHYSHDGINLEIYKKGDLLTSEQTSEEVLDRYVALGIAEFVDNGNAEQAVDEAPENDETVAVDEAESEAKEEIEVETKAVDEAPENKAINGADVKKKKSKQ